jgi:hypothetical protein
MMFKNGKDEAMWAIYNKVHIEVQTKFVELSGQPLNQALPDMIAHAITVGLAEMLKQQYSDEDLEKDLQLNKL